MIPTLSQLLWGQAAELCRATRKQQLGTGLKSSVAGEV